MLVQLSRLKSMPMISLLAITLLVLSHRVSGLQLDNGVVGTPQVRCSESAITFSVRSQNIFRGNIYVKGQYGVRQCRQEYTTNDFNGASYTVNIDDCGMRRFRQLAPHGMAYQLVFVVNFHPQFVTKVDRAYNVRCFYAQSDKTVTSQLDVSMLQTESLDQATMLAPNCQYSVRRDSLNGQLVRFARVGDRLVHRWECDNPNFGMLVKNCFVNDGAGSSVRVLDSRGCPVFSPVIQGNLQYDNSLNLAFTEIWAYKFPDRSQLFFQCQIQICNKRDNECVGVTPPNCPLVNKNDFNPNSNINTNVDPNEVRGTFGGSGFNVDPNVSGLRPIQPVVSRPGTGGGFGGTGAGGITGTDAAINANVNQGYGYGGTRIGQGVNAGGQGVQGGTYGYGGNTGNIGFQTGGSSQAVSGGQGYGYGGTGNIGFQTGFSGTQPAGAGGGLQPARPYARRLKDLNVAESSGAELEFDDAAERQQRSAALENEINIWKYLPANLAAAPPPQALMREMDETELRLAEDENEDETLDVASESLFIVDRDELVEGEDEDANEKDYTHFPFGTHRSSTTSDSHSMCLNKLGVSLLFTTFILMLLCMGGAAAYIAFLWRRQDAELNKEKTIFDAKIASNFARIGKFTAATTATTPADTAAASSEDSDSIAGSQRPTSSRSNGGVPLSLTSSISSVLSSVRSRINNEQMIS